MKKYQVHVIFTGIFSQTFKLQNNFKLIQFIPENAKIKALSESFHEVSKNLLAKLKTAQEEKINAHLTHTHR